MVKTFVHQPVIFFYINAIDQIYNIVTGRQNITQKCFLFLRHDNWMERINDYI